MVLRSVGRWLQHTFALTSEVRKKNGSQVATERLDLAFETMDDAVKWRENIAQQVPVFLPMKKGMSQDAAGGSKAVAV